MTTEYIIDAETAHSELERFADAMDLDITIDDDLDKKERKEAQKSISTVLRAIRSGRLVIDDDGIPTFTPTKNNVAPIRFNEPTGATLIAADKFGDNQKLHKLYAMLAEMAGVPSNTFSKLAMSDLKEVLAVGGLFLG